MIAMICRSDIASYWRRVIAERTTQSDRKRKKKQKKEGER